MDDPVGAATFGSMTQCLTTHVIIVYNVRLGIIFWQVTLCLMSFILIYTIKQICSAEGCNEVQGPML
jgi:hypothetical protein